MMCGSREDTETSSAAMMGSTVCRSDKHTTCTHACIRRHTCMHSQAPTPHAWTCNPHTDGRGQAHAHAHKHLNPRTYVRTHAHTNTHALHMCIRRRTRKWTRHDTGNGHGHGHGHGYGNTRAHRHTLAKMVTSLHARTGRTAQSSQMASNIRRPTIVSAWQAR